MNYAENLLARRYALALLRVCGEQFSSEHLAAMRRTIQFFKTHTSALYFLTLPDLPVHIKEEQIRLLFEALTLPGCFFALVQLLCKQKRLQLIGRVLEHALAFYQEQHNILDMHIESSMPLEEAQLKIIQEFLARQSAKTVQYTYRVNPDLIAGIRAQSDTLLWEYSVRKKLRAIRLSVIR